MNRWRFRSIALGAAIVASPIWWQVVHPGWASDVRPLSYGYDSPRGFEIRIRGLEAFIFGTTTAFVTSGTTWTVPSSVTSVTAYCLGAGGTPSSQNGAEGGAYATGAVSGLTPGNNVSIQIGAGGGQTATWFSSSTTVAAQSGSNSTTARTTSGNYGTTTKSGGIGGAYYKSGLSYAGGGGGGAGGPNGAGKAGAAATTTTAAGAGGAGNNGSAGGGTAGTAGSGTNGAGGAGGSGTYWTATVGGTAGPGGGGGGGCASTGNGGAGGSYGGGGGGYGTLSGSGSGTAGTGGAGLIVLTYTAGTAWTHTASETLTLTDATVKNPGKVAAETLSFTDAANKQAGKKAAETLSFTDAWAQYWATGGYQSAWNTSTVEYVYNDGSIGDTTTYAVSSNSATAAISSFFYEGWSAFSTSSFQFTYKCTASALTTAWTLEYGTTTSLSGGTLTSGTLTADGNWHTIVVNGLSQAGLYWRLSIKATYSVSGNVYLSDWRWNTSTAWAKTASETLSFTDAANKGISATKLDTLSFVDAANKSPNKIASEPLSFTDVRQPGIGKSETLSFSDAANKGPTHLVSEGLSFIDAGNKAFGKLAGETLAFTDQAIKVVAKLAAESLGLSDYQAIYRGLVATVTEGLTFTDTAPKGISVTKLENFLLVDYAGQRIIVPTFGGRYVMVAPIHYGFTLGTCACSFNGGVAPINAADQSASMVRMDFSRKVAPVPFTLDSGALGDDV